MAQPTGAPHVLIAGGGYVGLYTALRLERRLDPGEADVTLVNPHNFMVYQPLLPEVASGTLEPRHAVVPLRKVLRRTRLLTGELSDLDAEGRRATVRPLTGEAYDLPYTHAVVGLGSVTRLLPVPGLAQRAVGFQTVTEAIHLHNHVLECLETAEASRDPRARERALTFVLVGGGYTGVEVIAELEDMVTSALGAFSTVTRDDLRWVLVEATGRVLPTVTADLARHALHELRTRGIEVRLETTVEKVADGAVRLSGGEQVPTDTLVWMTGIQPHPLAAMIGLPTDEQQRVVVDEYLRVEGAVGLWAAGDVAAIPDGEGGFHPPTAQHAQREARRLADNVAATLRGSSPRPLRYSSHGEFVTLGNRKGVAVVYGRQLRGLPSWLLRRLYYASQIPTLDRKARILVEWLVGSLFRREVVSLGAIEEPRAPIEHAAEHTDPP